MLRGLFARGFATIWPDWNAGKPDTDENRGVMGETWSEEELLDLEGAEPQLFCGEVINPCGICGLVWGEIGVKEVALAP